VEKLISNYLIIQTHLSSARSRIDDLRFHAARTGAGPVIRSEKQIVRRQYQHRFSRTQSFQFCVWHTCLIGWARVSQSLDRLSRRVNRGCDGMFQHMDQIRGTARPPQETLGVETQMIARAISECIAWSLFNQWTLSWLFAWRHNLQYP
jgi:hypothetical protein